MIRTTVVDATTLKSTGRMDQTTVNSVTAGAVEVLRQATPGLSDGVVVIHGFADPNLDVSAVENRLVANRDSFDINGRRTLRAGGPGVDGTLTWDNPSARDGKWTATYTGLDGDDVARAAGGVSVSTNTAFVGAESRGIWLGRDPLALTEQTIYEFGAVGGPAAPCAV